MPRVVRLVGPILLLALVYATVARISMAAAVIQGNTSPLWPPAGIALVAVVIWGPRIAPGVLLGEMAVMLSTGSPLWAALLEGTGNMLAALLAAYAFRRAGGRPQLDRLRDVAVVIALCGAGAALVSSGVGVSTLVISKAIPLSSLASTWWVWWLGDAAGVLVCAPMLFAAISSPPRRIRVEWAVAMALVLAVAVPVLWAQVGQPYVLCLVLAWIGLWLGPPAAATANLLVAIVAVHITVDGHGPFVRGSVSESLLATQTFLLVTAIMSMVVAAVAAELRASRHALATLAGEQAALREVAEAIARQAEPEVVWAVAEGVLASDGHGAPLPAARSDAFGEQLEQLLELGADVASARAELVLSATTDALTGLANYGAFQRALAVELGRATRHGLPLALVVFDVDGFKRVNDAHGHLVGDEVLRAVAQSLRACARAEDVLARLGGDELALLMPETSVVGALHAAERCCATIVEARLGPGGDLTISSGVADLATAATADLLVRQADEALYRVKANGGNACATWDPEAMGQAAGA